MRGIAKFFRWKKEEFLYKKYLQNFHLLFSFKFGTLNRSQTHEAAGTCLNILRNQGFGSLLNFFILILFSFNELGMFSAVNGDGALLLIHL